MVVGLFPSVKFERGYVRLNSGDIVVACTDGITEAANTADEEFGSQNLAEWIARQRALPADQLVESVMSEVDRFSKGGTHEDDRVILVLKVE